MSRAKVGVVSLGCSKNLVDTEVMLGHLDGAGFSFVPGAEDADVLVVNTCAFIEASREESIRAILDAAALKKEGRLKRLVVAGCMVQRYRAEREAELGSEVDAFVGLDELHTIVPAAGGVKSDLPILSARPNAPEPSHYLYTAATPRRLSTSPWTAFVKIAEGCDHTCSFCAIPGFRGAFRSRHVSELKVEAAPAFDKKGTTFLEAVMLGVGDALAADDRVFVFGQDVGGQYGNAFLMLRPLLKDYGSRILNSPLAEGAVLGTCVGAALAGLRPIGEMQFNDFVATGFNQLVNNAAKIRYRWGGEVPMVVRMPWGGLRHAGPYHSQNTEPWFFRTPGLKIVVPSTPHDARALMAAAVADPDPVLYYEHIGLYRDPRIKQLLDPAPPAPLPIGKAALRRAGTDLTIISYGAYVHVAIRVAEKLSASNIEAAVLDLRSLVPLDREAVLDLARATGRVLIVHEDSRTGGIGESIAACIQEQAFEWLDAPVRIMGALDTPVPYSPPLEEAFLPGEADVERAARLLAAY